MKQLKEPYESEIYSNLHMLILNAIIYLKPADDGWTADN
jgi:hypothetical protein